MEVLRQRCLRVESARVCLGSHHEVVRNASVVVETGLAAVPGSMVVCGAAVVEGFERSADGMRLSTSPTLIIERVDDVCTIASTPLPLGWSLAHSHGPVRPVLTVILGLSVHATVQCGVLALRRQPPLCTVMVDASQTRCGVSIWKGDGSARCGRRRCSGSRRVVCICRVSFVPCWVLGDGETSKVNRLVADGFIGERLHCNPVLTACWHN